jgi:DNA polymerase-3 subunit epsilon
MITCIFDTETTGLPNKALAPDDPKQARIMQIAAILIDDEFKQVGQFCVYIKPENWPVVHSKAFEAHGITEELCREKGVDARDALRVFDMFVTASDRVLAFNLKFDSQLIDIEMARQSWPWRFGWETDSKFICPMCALTPVMKLTRANGAAKWPNLGEAYTWATGKTMEKAHDALVDVQATAEVWKAIIERKVLENEEA